MHSLNIYIDETRIKASLSEEELSQILNIINVPEQTGYERADIGDVFFYNNSYGEVCPETEGDYPSIRKLYAAANYYSSEEVAENNSRADKLMRNLRRFAAENRGENWQLNSNWCIVHSMDHVGDYTSSRFHFREDVDAKSVNTVYFDSKKTAAAALRKYYEEIKWYFEEYQSSL